MKATALEITVDDALVELRPCWLARLLGARTVRVELRWVGDRKGHGEWRAVNTGRELRYLPHAGKIRHALDYRPVRPLPEARSVQR